MTASRRALLRHAALAAGLPLLPRSGYADGFPARPVRLVTGFAPGGPMDIVARLMAGWLSARLGQPCLVENHPGAGGNLGTEAVLRAAPDGHTLLVCGPVNAINAALYPRLPFDFARDAEPVAGIVRVPLVLVVHPAVPATDAPAFIRHVRANPGRVALASAGNGTPQHVAGEMFRQMAGLDLLAVPYRGSGPALADLVGGQVQAMFDAMPSAIGHIREGRIRALAVTTAEPSPVLPALPPLAATLPGYEASSWYGLVAPRGTPTGAVARLSAEVNAGLADPGIQARLADLGGTPMPGTPAALGQLIAAETARWAAVVRTAGLRAE